MNQDFLDILYIDLRPKNLYLCTHQRRFFSVSKTKLSVKIPCRKIYCPAWFWSCEFAVITWINTFRTLLCFLPPRQEMRRIIDHRLFRQSSLFLDFFLCRYLNILVILNLSSCKDDNPCCKTEPSNLDLRGGVVRYSKYGGV